MRSLTPAELAQRLRQAPPVLLDVREDWELALAALPDARHIPLHEIPHRVSELDPNDEIVVVCHHGVRSAQAVVFLGGAGFRNVYNLTGGIDAWAREIDPTLPRY